MEEGSVSQEDKWTPEMAIWQELYWPDGTRKRRLKTIPIDERRCSMLQLVKALVDKYNDDHNLLGDLAYKLQRLGRYKYFHDAVSDEIYYHINFTTNTKGVDARGCYACLRNVLHPKAAAYSGGLSETCRFRGMFSYNGPVEDLGYTSAELEAEEASVRRMYELEAEEASVRCIYEGLDPSDFLERQIEEGC